jgi:hypothetical protein
MRSNLSAVNDSKQLGIISALLAQHVLKGEGDDKEKAGCLFSSIAADAI